MARTVLVISDMHGMHDNLRELVRIEEGRYDAVFHLGDTNDNADLIRSICGCPVTFVRGNCDSFSDFPEVRDFKQWGHHFFMTHGHRYFIYRDPADLAAEAASRGADVALFGHTHTPLMQMIDDVLVINPGSLSKPRQSGRAPSYVMLTVEEGSDVACELKYLPR